MIRSEETMKMINDLTPQIVGKSFDPGWFVLRQRLEEVDQREAEALAIIERAVTKGIHPAMSVDRQWMDRAWKWLKGGKP